MAPRMSLNGVRVVSTAVNVPGPVAASLLRDMGAQVTKVEPPSGDPLAAFAPEWHAALSGSMEVLTLDLKGADGAARAVDLLARADLLITSIRPSSLGRLGFAWPSLHARHPNLCHVAIVGYGAPRGDIAGHDLTYQAEAGLVDPPELPRTLIADLAGAQRVVIAALELLLQRDRNGEAGYKEVALADAASLFGEPIRHGLTSRAGLLGGADPAYSIYPAKEGFVAVAALEMSLRALMTRELGVDVNDRAALAAVLLTKSAADWQRWAEERGLPLSRVR